MNIADRIAEIRTLIYDGTGLSTYLELAPQNAVVPYVVISNINATQTRSTTNNTNWESEMTVSVRSSQDTQALAFADSVVDSIDRAKSEHWYFCRIGNAAISADYLEKGQLWTVTLGLNVSWITPI